jgi:histone H3/H4
MSNNRKVIHDAIQGITKPALQRLAFKAGAKSVTGLSYSTLREILSAHLHKVIQKSLAFTEVVRRTTLRESDVREALKLIDRTPIYGETSQVGRRSENLNQISTTRVVKNRETNTAKKCPNYAPKGRQNRNQNENQAGGSGDYYDRNVEIDEDADDITDYDPYASQDYDPYNDIDDTYNSNDDYYSQGNDVEQREQFGGRRNRPGTVATRKIKYYQKQSGACFCIPKQSFIRLIKEIAQNYHLSLRYSPEALNLIQMDAENYLVDLLHNANMEAIHARRIRIAPKDLQLALKLCSKSH